MKEFRFTFGNLQTRVVFGETSLAITDPWDKHSEIQYTAIQHWYSKIDSDGSSPTRAKTVFRTLIISHLLPDGTLVHTDFRADEHNLVFTHLVDWMAAEFPSQSLESLSEFEANKIMKIRNRLPAMIIFGISSFWALICLFSWPATVHMFDLGFARASLSDISRGKIPGSRNVALYARLLLNHADTVEKRHSSDAYFPMVDSTWKKGDSVLVVGYLGVSKYTRIDSSGWYYAVIRDMAGERIDSAIPDRFGWHDSLRVAEQPLLLELTTEKPHSDGIFYVYAVTGILILISSLFTLRKSKRKPKAYELVHGRNRI